MTTNAPPRQRLLSRKGSRAVKFGVVAAMLLLLVAAVYTAVLIGQRQATLQQVTRYNITWLLAQASLEVSRLNGAVAAAMVPGSGVDDAEVELRLDIVDNRVGVLSVADAAKFLSSSPVLAAIVEQFRTVAAQARAEFASTAPDRLLRMHALIGQLHAPLSRLAAAGHDYGGTLTLADQSAISFLHWTLVAILIGVTLCGFGLVGILALQNRMLSQTRDRIRHQNHTLQLRDDELNLRNARFDAALNNMSQALCMVDAQQRLIVCNVQFLTLFGIAGGRAQPGAPVMDVFRAAAAAGRYGVGLMSNMSAWQECHAEGEISCTFTEADEDGVALAVTQEPMAGGGWVATFEDITERRRAEARIGFLAHHDALTGLPNRRLFHMRLQNALDRHAQSAESVAVLCLDLDRFKQVNDTLGHAAGDALLKSVASRLQACTDAEMVVRLSGDEFAVLQSGAEQPVASEALARRIIEALGQPHDIEGHQVVVGASIGIAVMAPCQADVDILMRCADIALYRAKGDGRGRFRTFEGTMDAEMQARRTMAADLREALGRGEFQVFYQPLFQLAGGRVCAFEALLRWRHPVRGTVSPATFIPLAEELGLIVPIGEWVLTQACLDAAAWPCHVKVAVNLSPTQLRSPGLFSAVQRALDLSGVSPSRLELEITETVLLHDSQTVLATLRQLNDLGLCIALDDFGTGYSSLSYLRSFPFGKLKIDQSFIQDVATRPECEAIVRSVTSLASMLGMTTTAEGVEGSEQLERLRNIGCTEVQGFLFDPPRPVADIQHWFTDRMPLSPPGSDMEAANYEASRRTVPVP